MGRAERGACVESQYQMKSILLIQCEQAAQQCRCEVPMLTSVAMGFVSAICAGRSWPAAFQRMSSRFAADSPLEEAGFEPLVPPWVLKPHDLVRSWPTSPPGSSSRPTGILLDVSISLLGF